MRRVRSIILVICIIAPFVQTVSKPGEKNKVAVGTSQSPTGIAKDKGAKETSEDPVEIEEKNNEPYVDDPVVMGVFKTDSFISLTQCEVLCKTQFGYIILSHETSLPITKPGDSSNPLTCSCFLNVEPMREYLITKKLSYENFSHMCKKSFCDARLMLRANNVMFKISYETDAHKMQKEISVPTETSTDPTGTTKKAAKPPKAGAAKDKDEAGTSKGPTETAKNAAETSPHPKIIVGVFLNDRDITTENCKKDCRTSFGYIIPYPGSRIAFSQPSISANRKACSCLLNVGPVRDYCIEKGINYEELFNNCKKSYCAGKVWFEQKHVPVEVQYEVEARNLTGTAKDGAKCSSILLATGLKKQMPALRKTATTEDCKGLCNKKFGFIVPISGDRLPITTPKITENENACDCFMNIAVADYLTKKSLDCRTLASWCKKSHCKQWLVANKIEFVQG